MADRPDFFIAGAPKAGTTALYEYLRHHPDVCMPDCKEPQYFATDLPQDSAVKSEAEYLQLFRDCADATAVGEASVWYLYSEVALGKIRSFNGGGRIIVMLRNPVELVHALHGQLLFSGVETEPDFEAAWGLQDMRGNGEKIPKACTAPLMLQYREIGMLGSQLDRAYQTFSEEQVLPLFFDDLVANPADVYRQALAFLGLQDDGRNQFETVNESRLHRSQWLGNMTEVPPGILAQAARSMRRYLGINTTPLLRKLRQLNQTPAKRQPVTRKFRKTLQDVYRDDIQRLEELTGRSLAHWINTD